VIDRHTEDAPTVERVLALKTFSVLAALEADDLAAIAERVRRDRLPCGALLTNDGGAPDAVHLVIEGEVDLGLEPVPKPLVLGQWGPRHVWRRHHAGTELPDHLLPELRVVAHPRQVEPFEREVGRPGAVVVTAEAVPIEKRALCVGG
jgi:hypothetical protein